MLTDAEVLSLMQRLGLTAEAVKIAQAIRHSEPSRVVNSGQGNVCVRYPSRKMGKTIQAESHKNELAAIYAMEHDPNTLEYYDQPPPIKLNYRKADGHSVGFLYAPCFFVIRADWIGWEEWKTEETLQKLAKAHPERYVKDGNQWRCPPAETYAAQFGMSFSLHSTDEINWVLQNNLVFLEDYFSVSPDMIKPEARSAIANYLQDHTVTILSDLINLYGKVSTDDLFGLIAQNEICCDLEKEDIRVPAKFHIYRDAAGRDAYSSFKSLNTTPTYIPPTPKATLVTGNQLTWDAKPWIILNVGETEVTLKDEDDQIVTLPHHLLNNLIDQGKVTGISEASTDEAASAAEKILLSASPEELAEANRRHKLILPLLKSEQLPRDTPNRSSLYRFFKEWRSAEEVYGNGFIGLIPNIKGRGNRNSKLPEKTLEIINGVIETDYESLRHGNIWNAYARIKNRCEEEGIMAPTYETVRNTIHARPKHAQVLKREGRRAAYPHSHFYWHLVKDTPRHGSRPFDIAHIDHTQLDLELISSTTGKNLGRPWLTLMVDAYSRRILASVLTFDPPSYRSCMMVLRECVRLNHRLPQTIVVDNGAEFHSTFFESVLARFGVTKKSRPPAKSRFGSICERLFGITNTELIHNLEGNTQITKNVRTVTQSVLPANHAIWTLPRLQALLDGWIQQVYEVSQHPALGMSPREAFDQGIALTGARTHKTIPYTEEFIIFTSPTTSKGTAKVSPTHGIKVNNINYWSQDFRDPQVANTDVPVRYDPFNSGIAYAFVKNRWVKCFSEHYTEFEGRTEREIRLATAELKKQLSDHHQQRSISAARLARYLKTSEAQDVLALQRMQDAELKKATQQGDSKPPQPQVTANAPENLVSLDNSSTTTADEPTTLRPPKLLDDF